LAGGAGSVNATGLYSAPGNPTVATVKATSVQNNGISGSATVIVTSPLPIMLTVQPSDVVPIRTQLTITASGGTGFYTWAYPNMANTTINGAGNNTLIGKYLQTGSYKVTVEDSIGTQASVTITVVKPNQIEINPSASST